MKRGICAALVFCLLFSVCIPCFAEEAQPSVSPRYAYISTCNYSLSINSAGVAQCKASCTALSTSYKVRVNCYYQYYNNAQWSSYKFFTNTGNYYASVNQQANTISGITNYRIKVVFTIYDSSDNQLETVTYYDYETYTPST